MSLYKKVLIGLSGGIDSAMTAYLLKERGYEVISVTFKFRDNNTQSHDPIILAESIAQKLEITHHIIDYTTEFSKKVINVFASEYLCGNTPSICPICNEDMKFPLLLQLADKYECEFIATGHYIRIENSNGKFYVKKGIDEVKDQSYFLWRLNQDILSRWITPMGDFMKNEIKKLADKIQFTQLINTGESMGVCFLQNQDYKTYLLERYGKEFGQITEGNIITLNGKVVGKHEGYPFYTVGQKRGLKLFTDEEYAVKEIHSGTNTIIVDHPDNLTCKELVLDNVHIIDKSRFENEKNITVKVRGIGLNPTLPVTCKYRPDGRLHVFLNDTAWAVAPGQSVVFYAEDVVLGGGIVAYVPIK